jgi:hypothetical protein
VAQQSLWVGVYARYVAGVLSGGLLRILARLARSLSSLALAGVLVSLTVAPAACAHGRTTRAHDVAATSAYIEADYQLARVGRAELSASLATIKALVQRTVAECPLAGEGAYVNHAANQISEEVLGTVEVAAYQPEVGAIRAAAHALKHLRWSNNKLTRHVEAFVVKLGNLPAIAPANICADVKAYAATAFTAAPEATIRFIQLFHAAELEPEEVPWRLLAPYEGPRQTKQVRAIKRMEAIVAEAEAHAVAQWMAIMRGLDLSV